MTPMSAGSTRLSGPGGSWAGSFLRPTPSRVGRRAIVIATFIELGPLVVCLCPRISCWRAYFVSQLVGGVLYQVRGSIGLQQRVPTELLGRVNAVIRSGMYIGMLIGAVAAAVLVQPLGWQATVLIVSAAAFTFLVVASLVQPRRRFQHPAELIPD